MSSFDTINAIDELLHHFGVVEVRSFEKGIVSTKIEQILNLNVKISPHILCTIQDLMVNETYAQCDESTPFLIGKLFEYYYNAATTENEETKSTQDTSSHTEIHQLKWKILLHIIETMIPYFYKHNILTNEVIWNEMIQKTMFHHTENEIQISRKVSLLLLLLTHCGDDLIRQNKDTSVLIETKLFLKQYIISYVPSIKYAEHEYIDMQCIHSVLLLIDDNIHSEHRKPSKKPSKKRMRKQLQHEYEQRCSSQMEEYFANARLRPKEEVYRSQLMWNIDRLWKKVLFQWYPTLKKNHKLFDKQSYITLFGSVATKLEDRTSKSIDIYLSVPSHLTTDQLQNDQNELLKQLAIELNANGFTSSGIVDCTAPSITVIVDDTQIHICYDEYNDKSKMVQLVKALCQHNVDDIRVNALIIFIKHWSKARNINSSMDKFNKKSRLSSFCVMLLIFKYLQTQCDDDRGEAKFVLPLLKKERHFNGYKVVLDVEDKSNSYNTYLKKEKEKKKASKKRARKIRKLSLYALLSGFFEFYSAFDYDKFAISLFHRDVVEKKGGGNKGSYRDLNQRELATSRLVFVIEYPLQTNYNCAMNVTKDNAMLLKLECLRAKLILSSANGNLHDLCRPVMAYNL